MVRVPQEMSDYMACLRESSYTTERCKHLSKRYLECRMSKCVSFAPAVAEARVNVFP